MNKKMYLSYSEKNNLLSEAIKHTLDFLIHYFFFLNVFSNILNSFLHTHESLSNRFFAREVLSFH